MKDLIQSAKDKPVLASFAATAVSITAIFGAAKALDIRLIPWATASEISDLKKEVADRQDQILELLEQLAENQKAADISQATLLREFWEKRLEEAEEDLRVNPNSRAARAQKLEAKRNIDQIDQKLAGVPPRAALPSEDQ